MILVDVIITFGLFIFMVLLTESKANYPLVEFVPWELCTEIHGNIELSALKEFRI